MSTPEFSCQLGSCDYYETTTTSDKPQLSRLRIDHEDVAGDCVKSQKDLSNSTRFTDYSIEQCPFQYLAAQAIQNVERRSSGGTL